MDQTGKEVMLNLYKEILEQEGITKDWKVTFT